MAKRHVRIHYFMFFCTKMNKLIVAILLLAAATPSLTQDVQIAKPNLPLDHLEKLRILRDTYANLPDEVIAEDMRTYLQTAVAAAQNDPSRSSGSQPDGSGNFAGPPGFNNGGGNLAGPAGFNNGGGASIAAQAAQNFLPIFQALFG